MRSVRNRAAAVGETHAAAGIVADHDSPLARDEVLGGGVERERRLAEQLLLNAPGRRARRRRNRSGRTAAIRGRAGRKLGIADADRDLLGTKPKNLGDGLRHHRADAGADILHARQHLDRAVAHDAHLAGRVGLHIGAPERLRHAETALHRPRIGAGGVPALPTDPLGADTPLLAPHRTGVDAVAQDERINGQAFRPIRRSSAPARRRRAYCLVRASRSPVRH